MRTTAKVVTGLLAVSAVVLTAACAGTNRRTEDPPSPVGATTSTDSPNEFPSVLSTTTADSGRTVTTTMLSAELASDDAPPEGFRDLSVVVANGLGSFTVAVPSTYSVLWRAGTSPEELLAEGSRRDPSWAEYAQPRLTSARPDGALRAVVLDSAPSDQVRALFITLSDASDTSGDDLAEEHRRRLADIGHIVNEAHGVRVNGADGAYVEFTATMSTGLEPRTVMQVLIPDPPNDVLWGLTCEVPETERADVAPICADIAATFRPLPHVSG